MWLSHVVHIFVNVLVLGDALNLSILWEWPSGDCGLGGRLGWSVPVIVKSDVRSSHVVNALADVLVLGNVRSLRKLGVWPVGHLSGLRSISPSAIFVG